MVARAMASEMSGFLGDQIDDFRAKHAPKIELLADDASQTILTERLSRLLAKKQWTRADMTNLASLFFLLAASMDEEDGG